MNLWPHQQFEHDKTIEAVYAGDQRICVTSPTGGGKSKMMVGKIQWAQERGWPVSLYTNRRMLLDQTSRVLTEAGIDHSIRAAKHKPNFMAPVQLSMVQTEGARTLKGKWQLHHARLVLIDEAHINKAGTMLELANKHIEQEAVIVGYTATPLEIGHMYDKLIVAGVTSELRDCGALLPADIYAPDEPDSKKLKRTKTGEYTEQSVRKAIMTPTIFGRVYDHWKKLNPDARPALLFGPGVAESKWFAQEFEKKGVRFAHIDGDDVYVDGETYTSDAEAREQIVEESRTGALAGICNRFVLREGIDLPWLAHGIFATSFGALTSYLQSGGRILRNHPSLERVIIQDHGGNYHRHGSLNADRNWELGQTNNIVSGIREQRLRENKEPEPIQCPKCHMIRLSGPQCLNKECGYRSSGKVRMVMQTNGDLKEMAGDIYKPRRRAAATPSIARDWERMYHRSIKADRTFAAAEALFAMEHNWCYPPRTLPLMPTNEADWFRPVKRVPRDHLTKGKEDASQV